MTRFPNFKLIHLHLSTQDLPLYSERVPCGFPSPAESHIKKRLSIKDLIADKPSTFFLEAVGNSMLNCGIKTGTILVCEKGAPPKNNNIVLCTLNGNFMVKKYKIRRDSSAYLKAENNSHPPIEIQEGDELIIEAIVTHSINKH